MFKKKTIIIRYMGGLGNQMFQYALRCYFEQKGKLVKDDLRYYENNPNVMPFRLKEFFPNILLNPAEDKEVNSFYEKKKARNILIKIVNKVIPSTRLIQEEKRELKYNRDILRAYSAYVMGYWQSYRYVEKVEDTVKKRFEFFRLDEEDAEMKQIKSSNSVSLHIRAGDYLLPENNAIFGGICTIDYYRTAIELIKKQVENPLFFVFSNDIGWCKKNIPLENVVWVDSCKKEKYEDWMDMYLMASCKHNIVANSSFSWWAAWLNTNPNKIVIAPKKWTNIIKKDEVCPKNWIRI